MKTYITSVFLIFFLSFNSPALSETKCKGSEKLDSKTGKCVASATSIIVAQLAKHAIQNNANKAADQKKPTVKVAVEPPSADPKTTNLKPISKEVAEKPAVQKSPVQKPTETKSTTPKPVCKGSEKLDSKTGKCVASATSIIVAQLAMHAIQNNAKKAVDQKKPTVKIAAEPPSADPKTTNLKPISKEVAEKPAVQKSPVQKPTETKSTTPKPVETKKVVDQKKSTVKVAVEPPPAKPKSTNLKPISKEVAEKPICHSESYWDEKQKKCVNLDFRPPNPNEKKPNQNCKNIEYFDSKSGKCVLLKPSAQKEICLLMTDNSYWDEKQQKCINTKEICHSEAYWDEKQKKCVNLDFGPPNQKEICHSEAYWDEKQKKCVNLNFGPPQPQNGQKNSPSNIKTKKGSSAL